MRYKQLLNQTYLFYRQHPGQTFLMKTLEEELQLNHKTIAKQKKEMETYNELLPISNFHNEIKNKYLRAVSIVKDIDDNDYTLEEMASLLDVSPSTLNPYFSKKKGIKYSADSALCGVYGIFYGDECIYIGFSTNVKKRLLQHQSRIKCLNNNVLNEGMEVYNYCLKNNYKLEDLRFEIFCQSNDIKAMKSLEGNLFSNFKPKGNVILQQNI